VDNFTISDTEFKIGDNATVTLEFSEAVCTVSSDCGGIVFSSDPDITVPNLDSGPRRGIASGTLTTMTSDDNETWRGTFTPATNTEDDTNYLSLATTYTDLAGNNGPDNETENYEVDTRAPTVSVAISDAATEGRLTYESGSYGFLNEGDNVSVTATFSERVIVESGTPTLPLVVGSDNRTATYTSGDNSTALVFRYTIQAGDNDSNGISILGNTLALNSSTIKDAALNNAILTHSEVSDNNGYIVDTTPPTVSSVAITSATNKQYSLVNAGDNVSVTVTFSETPISAVIVESGTATLTLVVGSANRTATLHSGSSTIVSGSDNASLVFQYTIQATGTSGENDDDGISIGANALNSNSITIMDAAGNIATDLTHSAVSDNTGYKVDTTELTVNSFTISDTLLVVGDNATVDLVFSEPASFSSDDDITVANGTLAAMTSSDNTTWTGTFTPAADTEEDNNTLSLATSYTDTAGNAGPSETTANYEVDTLAPSVSSFTLSDTALKAGDNATVELVFSEEVIEFSAADINLDNATGTLSTMSSSDNITWTGTFTPTANTEDASNTLSLGTSYTDTAGNAGPAATTANYAVETLAPSVDNFTLSDTALKAGDNATVTLRFSEAVVSFSSAADITADNGTLAAMSSADNITWAGTFTPTANTEDENNTLSLATSYTDTAGNAGPAATTANYAVETLAPTVNSVAISSASGVQNSLLNAGDNVSVTATFSESVIVDNASGTPTLTLVVGSDNRTATYASGSGSTPLVFQYTIQAEETDSDGISIGANVLALNSGTIRDAAGNDATITHSPVADNSSYMVDTTAPTANFTAATDDVGTVTGALTSGDTTDDTALVLSGTNESGSSVMVYNSSTQLGAATVSGTSWSYSATVANGTTYQFNVRETDLAGNTSAATSNFAVTGDTTAPTVSSVAITSATGIQNNLLNAGDVISVTATFSENVPVTGTPQLTLVVGGTNRTATYTSGSGSTPLVFQYTIQAGETDSDGISIGANTLALNSGTIKDAAGNDATITHNACRPTLATRWTLRHLR